MVDYPIQAEVNGITLDLTTTPGLFSPRTADRGTLAMLAVTDIRRDDKVLDLGCGYGVVGIFAAKLIGAERVTMVDNDPEAIRLTRVNVERNGVAGVRVYAGDGLAAVPDAGYTLILCNPPYHVDFSLPKRFIEKGFNRLAVGGRLVMVTKRRDWYEAKLRAVFGGVRVVEQDGYHVFTAEKRRMTRGAPGSAAAR